MASAYESWAPTYESFEGRTSAETWEIGIVPEVASRADEAPTILDLGAGTGVGAKQLVSRMPQAFVTSLERSAEMIASGHFPGEVVQGDMTEFALETKYDFVVSGFDALNYVAPTALGSVFDCVRTHVVDGGFFVFDYSSLKVLREDWREEDYVNDTEVGRLERSHRWDDSTQQSNTSLTFSVEGEVRWHEVHTQYSIDTYDMWRIAARRGFEVLAVRNIDSSIFTPACTTHVWVLVAR